MKIVRIGFGNFRSIGPEPVILDLRKRVNLLIGANNSGKSNVLEILQRLKKQPLKAIKFSPVDLHQRKGDTYFQLLLDVEGTAEDELPDGVNHFHVGIKDGALDWKLTPFGELDWQELDPFMQKWTRSSWGRQPTREEFKEGIHEFASGMLPHLHAVLPEFHVIPEFRRITVGEYKIDGTGIAELLGHWKSPIIGEDGDQERFRKVEAFLRELLGITNIGLDVSRKHTELIVEHGKLRLPLTHYGTGIHQLIILAIAVLAHDDALIGIEEPEIHLHPLLQKAFLRFLVDKTSNRYVITTHSNAFLTRPKDCHITHLWLENGETKSRSVETTEHMLQVLNDLGVRAADILQANFVIWVEGPSDRIYLNHWLDLADPQLTEGIDYSIMFYGGRLLAHLSMERDEDDLTPDELIKLLRINQHSAILIDSDKKANGTELNDTKKRIVKECRGCGVFCWVTKGREIENYLAPEVIAKAYGELTGKERPVVLGAFQKIEAVVKKAHHPEWRARFAYEDNKPAFARRFIQHSEAIPDRLDLRERVKELVKEIRSAR